MVQLLTNPINTAKNVVSFFQTKDNGKAKLTLLTISMVAFSILANEFLNKANRTLEVRAQAKHLDLEFCYKDLENYITSQIVNKHPEIMTTYPINAVLGSLVSLTGAVFSSYLIERLNKGTKEAQSSFLWLRNATIFCTIAVPFGKFLTNNYKIYT